jgi:hypothetical protein
VIQRSSFDAVRGAVGGAVAGTIAAAIVTAACGGRAPGAAEPATSARETITAFMRAVADSNLTKMAELWGSSKGSAASTRQPSDYEKRIVVIQSYLRSDDYRVATDAGEGDGRRSMQIELRRQACTWTVPFTLIKADNGNWLVAGVDLTRAGNPARPCDPDAQDSTAHP